MFEYIQIYPDMSCHAMVGLTGSNVNSVARTAQHDPKIHLHVGESPQRRETRAFHTPGTHNKRVSSPHVHQLLLLEPSLPGSKTDCMVSGVHAFKIQQTSRQCFQWFAIPPPLKRSIPRLLSCVFVFAPKIHRST